MPTWFRRSLLAVGIGLVGCGAAGQATYRPLVVHRAAPPEVTYAAVERFARGAGWRQVAASSRDHRLAAIVDTSAFERDRVVIEITDRGDLRIDVRTEIASGESWLSSDSMCAGYTHARERQLAELIGSTEH